MRKKSDRKKLAKCKKEIEMKKNTIEKQRFLLFYRAQAKVAEAFFMVRSFWAPFNSSTPFGLPRNHVAV